MSMLRVEDCIVIGGQHFWVKVVHEPGYTGMQCYSCPMCNQLIYWSNITESWVNVTKKKNLRTRAGIKDKDRE